MIADACHASALRAIRVIEEVFGCGRGRQVSLPPALIERYRDRLPVEDRRPGRQPERGRHAAGVARALSRAVGVRRLPKFEGTNPTGSFKDRGMTVAVSAAERGAQAVICARTGNTAAAPPPTPRGPGLCGRRDRPEGKIALGKLAQAMIHGARVIAIDGNFDEALRSCASSPTSTRSSWSTRSIRTVSRARRPRLRDLRRARAGAGRAVYPGGQRRQHHRLLAGFQAECRARRPPG